MRDQLAKQRLEKVSFDSPARLEKSRERLLIGTCARSTAAPKRAGSQ
jgi:hypothetical protein